MKHLQTHLLCCGKVLTHLLLVGGMSPSQLTLRRARFTPTVEESAFKFMLEARARITIEEFDRTGVVHWASVSETCVSLGWRTGVPWGPRR